MAPRHMSRKLERARQSAASVRRLGMAGSRVLLRKLASFLETLTQEEIVNIPLAAEALARRPGGARGISHPQPPQPVEVVLARSDGEVIGAVLFRREWLEQVFDASGDNQRDRKIDATQRDSMVSDWLNGYGSRIGGVLRAEVGSLVAQLYMQSPDDCLDILEHSQTRPDALDRLWSLPLTQYFLPFIKSGSPQQKRRLRRLEGSALTDARGRSKVDPEDSKDAAIAADVESATARLGPAFDVWFGMRGSGAYQTRREQADWTLREMGFIGTELVAILGTRVDSRRSGMKACTTLSGAAHRLVALNRGQSIESVYARAKRGKRYL